MVHLFNALIIFFLVSFVAQFSTTEIKKDHEVLYGDLQTYRPDSVQLHDGDRWNSVIK